jgi:hypothetical protein
VSLRIITMPSDTPGIITRGNVSITGDNVSADVPAASICG